MGPVRQLMLDWHQNLFGDYLPMGIHLLRAEAASIVLGIATPSVRQLTWTHDVFEDTRCGRGDLRSVVGSELAEATERLSRKVRADHAPDLERIPKKGTQAYLAALRAAEFLTKVSERISSLAQHGFEAHMQAKQREVLLPKYDHEAGWLGSRAHALDLQFLLPIEELARDSAWRQHRGQTESLDMTALRHDINIMATWLAVEILQSPSLAPDGRTMAQFLGADLAT